MDNLPAQLFVTIGAITAALIAGAFSFFSLVSSKETKVSEFRQAWIDSLRNDIAVYVARLQTIYPIVVLSSKIGAHNNDMKMKIMDIHAEAKVAYNSIQLRINREEKDPKAKKINEDFISALDDANNSFENAKYDVLEKLLTDVVKKATPLLKMEWSRVRDGEPGYINAKRFALFISVGALISAACVTYALLSLSNKNSAPVLNESHLTGGASNTLLTDDAPKLVPPK
jgi:hypothetical protein